MTLSLPLLVLLVLILIGAVISALVAFQANRRRIQTLVRAGVIGTSGASAKIPLITLPDDRNSLSMRIGGIAERLLPDGAASADATQMLIQAGFESPAAPAIYALIRLITAFVVPGALFAWGPHDTSTMLLLSGTIGIMLGLIGPPAMLTRFRRLRQERIRRSIPDSLDLLLVCVEAGVSLDAAILRVGREMAMLHPELSNEFLMMNRRMNAGMRREDALHGLFERTGVDELRSLGSNMIQSERWGTSIAKVLRVYSESLRRKRRQAAEKKAAVAATKMIFPLALFILPALFAVIGGPAALAMGPVLDTLGK
jgi:tight adherence protein C